jgi:hypothetical protein
MTLEARLKRLEAQRWGGRLEGAGVAFEHDAKGEPIGARVTRWDGASFPLSRSPGETVQTFGLRAEALAGDLASVQAYVLSELRQVHGCDHQG